MFIALSGVGIGIGTSHTTWSVERVDGTPTRDATTTPTPSSSMQELPFVEASPTTSSSEVVTSKQNEDTKNLVEQGNDDTSSKSVETDVVDAATAAVERTVPFFSQFADISSQKWQKVGCGIASLAMLIDYYKPNEVTVEGLLGEGIAAHAYLDTDGWIHQGLIALAQEHGLTGSTHDLSSETMSNAFTQLTRTVRTGPVMVSVHYTFEPTNPIPHLVVVTGVDDEHVYYNDPAEPSGNGSISTTKFKRAWKQRYIAIRPAA